MSLINAMPGNELISPRGIRFKIIENNNGIYLRYIFVNDKYRRYAIISKSIKSLIKLGYKMENWNE